MSKKSLNLVVQKQISNSLTRHGNIQIKSEEQTPFGGIFHVMELFERLRRISSKKPSGKRSVSIGYDYSEIIHSLMCVYLCGGSCVEDVSNHLRGHLSLHPLLRACSSDTILRMMKELSCDNITYTSDTGKDYDFNTCDKVNELLINALVSTGQLVPEGEYDLDFDHEFLEAEKYDAKMTYKHFFGYSPGVAVINNMVAGIENHNGNANVRFHQQDTLERFYTRLEGKGITINRSRMDCGSCSEEIVKTVARHSKFYYIRANRCQSVYNDIFVLREWKCVEINGIEYELNSILVEKWKF